jgi:hypothetical protein
MTGLRKTLAIILLVVAVITVYEGRKEMTERPSGRSLAFSPEAGLANRLSFGVAAELVSWEVHDYYLVKVAYPEGSPDAWLMTTVLSGGTWHR